MTLVTDTLLDRLRTQLALHGPVVWYDPGRVYARLAGQLQPAQVGAAAVHAYHPERGFVWLRHALEPLWGPAVEPPPLLIYVPLSREQAAHALVEFEVAGAVLQPGQQPPEQDTALTTVARQALSGILPPAALDKILAEVAAGKWTLAELDQEAARGLEGRAGVLKLIFGSGNLADIALGFLADPDLDASLLAKQALPNLAAFLQDALDVPFDATPGAPALRVSLARLLLVTDLLEALHDVPPALKTFPVAARPAARQAAASLAQAWRNRRDLAPSYVAWAGRVAEEMHIGQLSLAIDALGRTEAFLPLEQALQGQVEAALLRHPPEPLLALARRRLQGFWSSQVPEVKARWQVVEAAARVLAGAARLDAALKGKAWSASALIAQYAAGDSPWCLLDTAQRHLERDYHGFDVDPAEHDSLIRLASLARQRYTAAADDLAGRFTRAYQDAGFVVPGVLQQADIYHDHVAPLAGQAPVAYILVDALRFEMALELASALDPAWQATLSPALATAPTITEVGMAALMPGAEAGLALVESPGGDLVPVVAQAELTSRAKRVDHFRAAVQAPVAVVKLSDLAPLANKQLAQQLGAARVILVTASEEIDGLGENNPSLARRTLDDALNQLRRGLKTLFNLGVPAAVVTADHGYLFGEKLTVGQGIDAPGGHTVRLKRRVWVGKGGGHSPAALRQPLSSFGIGGDLELVTPRSLACFKVPGGNTEYFHGGLSLQEVVIPVLVVRSGARPATAVDVPIEWTLTLGSKVISTRFVSLNVAARSTGLLPIQPPLVRAEVRAGSQVISIPVSASYGFDEATRDVWLEASSTAPQQVEPNTLTLMITETPAVAEATVDLLDAGTGRTLASLDRVPFTIYD